MSGDTIEGAGLAAVATLSAGVLGVLAARALPGGPLLRPAKRTRGSRSILAAQRLNHSSALLSLAVFADSSIEHYRGLFNNKAMVLPLVASASTLASSLHGAHDETQQAHRLRHGIAAVSGLIGVVGGGFHLYNVTKRAGGFSWHNLFYGAPLGAPYALILAGLMGTAAEHIRDSTEGRRRLFGLPAGPTLAGLTSAGLIGTVAEAALLHFRGAYHDPFMFLPVSVPPVAAGLMAKAGAERRPAWRRLTRAWLWLTALMGFAGCGFHIYGVSRNMGGWRNWSQNVLNGPPIPAPPSFTGLALAGLAALDLLEEHHG